MGLFDKTATATAGQDPGDTSTSGMGSLLPELFQKAVAEGTINPNNVSLQDFDSFVVTNPDIVDPSIDVSGLRTTTNVSPYLLGNIPDYGGIQYEAYNPSRLSDLMNLYSRGLPTLATDTAQIPGAVDTLVNVGGGGGGMDQVTGGSMLDTPTEGLTQSGTFGGQPTFTTIPGTTVDNVTGDITNPDGSYGGNIVDEVALTGGTTTPVDTSIAIEDFTTPFVTERGITGGPVEYRDQTQITDPVTPIQDLPMAQEPLDIPTQDVGLAYTGEFDPDDEGTVFDTSGLTDATPATELGSRINQAFENVKNQGLGAVESFKNTLVGLGGKVKEGFDNIVEFGDTQIDVGKTLATGAINYLGRGIFGPVGSLLGTALGAIKPDPVDTYNKSLFSADNYLDSDIYKADKDMTNQEYSEYKNRLGNYYDDLRAGNLPNQDPFGKNIQSLFGDYEAMARNIVNKVSAIPVEERTQFEKDQLNFYSDVVKDTPAPQEDIGATDTMQDLAIATGIQAAEDDKEDTFDSGEFDLAPSFEEFDTADFGITTTGINPFEETQQKTGVPVYDERLGWIDSVTEEPVDDPNAIESITGASALVDKAQKQLEKIEALENSDAYEFLSEEQKEQLEKDKQKIQKELNITPTITPVSLNTIDTGDDKEDTFQETTPTVNEADVEAGLATESIFDEGPAPSFGGFDSGGFDPGPAPAPTPTPDFYQDPITTGGKGNQGDPGRGKIVCTMMNESYGFGSFRNKIWLKHSKDLAPEYQIGYHKIFLPLVRLSKTNKLLKKTLEHIAVHRTIDIRQEARGKVHLLGRAYRKILEPICYWAGKYAKR
jgi:hypothetical protein